MPTSFSRSTAFVAAAAFLFTVSCKDPGGPDPIDLVPVATITVTPGVDTLAPGSVTQLTGETKSAAGDLLTRRAITWTSSDTLVATVARNGLLTARGEGSVIITASAEGQVGSAQFIVEIPVASVAVAVPVTRIPVGGTVTLLPTVTDAAGGVLTGREVRWSTNAPGTATVSQAGVVTGISKGFARITAEARGRSVDVVIEVFVPVSGLSVGPTPATLRTGTSLQLVAVPRDSSGTVLPDRPASWSSENPAVVSVGLGGLVTALAPGVVRISATVEGHTAFATITVVHAVAKVAVTPLSERLDAGTTILLAPYVTAATGDTLRDREVTWSSENPSVASVSTTGLVLGLQPGTARIQASVEGKSAFATITVFYKVGSITVTPSAASIVVSGAAKLDATVRRENGNAFDATVSWTSSNPGVAFVNDTGLVVGIGPGSATITASAGGKSASTIITTEIVNFSSVSAGSWHSCALATSGSAYCWGSARSALGSTLSVECVGDDAYYPPYTYTYACALAPTRVESDVSFASIATGANHTCGLTATGQAYCWGDNWSGQLGDGGGGEGFYRATPLPVVGGHSFRALDAGRDFTCGLAFDDRIYCWGTNYYGELGVGFVEQSATPVAISGGLKFTSFSSGGSFSCGITQSSTTYCWGYNYYRQLGNRSGAGLVETTETFSRISAGDAHACGLTAAGALFCWGSNSGGQKGTSSTVNTYSPQPVDGGHQFESVSAGEHHTCAITVAKVAYCWGQNYQGTLGSGNAISSSTPVRVSGQTTFSTISAGSVHTCGLTTALVAMCWGGGAGGRLGLGGTTEPGLVTAPTRVAGQP